MTWPQSKQIVMLPGLGLRLRLLKTCAAVSSWRPCAIGAYDEAQARPSIWRHEHHSCEPSGLCSRQMTIVGGGTSAASAGIVNFNEQS